jgi:signal transduction histidine kinase
MNRRLERVRTAAMRVALVSTGIAAVGYALVASVVVFIVTQNLTSQIDTRITQYLSRIENNGAAVPAGGSADWIGQHYGSPLLVWAVESDGSSLSLNSGVALPGSARTISNPTTVSIGGTEVRVGGIDGTFAIVGQVTGRIPHVVVGQTMDSVTQARSTVIVAESLVGVALLVVVFFGALAIGRRVGAPIELARQRQLEFTADASHELRTPLSVIEAQTSLALAQDRDPEWYRAAFQRISAESARIRRLVEDLLWLARVDVASTKLEAEPVEVGVLARQAADRFTAVAEARGLQMTVTSTDEAQVVMGSPEWLDRLFGVLLDNACKYAPSGGRVAVSVSDVGGRVRLAVEDSGPGIPPEERPRIFDRFHRATGRAAGSGLGLAIANAVVRQTHGRWEVGTSTLGGASMVVSWPRALAGAADTAPEVAAPELR